MRKRELFSVEMMVFLLGVMIAVYGTIGFFTTKDTWEHLWSHLVESLLPIGIGGLIGYIGTSMMKENHPVLQFFGKIWPRLDAD